MENKNIFFDVKVTDTDEFSEETLTELSNGKGDDEYE